MLNQAQLAASSCIDLQPAGKAEVNATLVQAGEPVFIVVDAGAVDTAGSFDLQLQLLE